MIRFCNLHWMGCLIWVWVRTIIDWWQIALGKMINRGSCVMMDKGSRMVRCTMVGCGMVQGCVMWGRMVQGGVVGIRMMLQSSMVRIRVV